MHWAFIIDCVFPRHQNNQNVSALGRSVSLSLHHISLTSDRLCFLSLLFLSLSLLRDEAILQWCHGGCFVKHKGESSPLSEVYFILQVSVILLSILHNRFHTPLPPLLHSRNSHSHTYTHTHTLHLTSTSWLHLYIHPPVCSTVDWLHPIPQQLKHFMQVHAQAIRGRKPSTNKQ